MYIRFATLSDISNDCYYIYRLKAGTSFILAFFYIVFYKGAGNINYGFKSIVEPLCITAPVVLEVLVPSIVSNVLPATSTV